MPHLLFPSGSSRFFLPPDDPVAFRFRLTRAFPTLVFFSFPFFIDFPLPFTLGNAFAGGREEARRDRLEAPRVTLGLSMAAAGWSWSMDAWAGWLVLLLWICDHGRLGIWVFWTGGTRGMGFVGILWRRA